jgi:uncharacterized protein YbaR (Trm112 family)
MTILICSTTYEGCGFIGDPSEWRQIGAKPQGDDELGEDIVICPQCREDHCFQLTAENLASLTNNKNRELAEKLLRKDESVIAKANCGCVHHAEEGIPCLHDIALARQQAGL